MVEIGFPLAVVKAYPPVYLAGPLFLRSFCPFRKRFDFEAKIVQLFRKRKIQLKNNSFFIVDELEQFFQKSLWILMASVENPLLLQDFIFPPYDVIEPRHVCPAVQTLLLNLVSSNFPSENSILHFFLNYKKNKIVGEGFGWIGENSGAHVARTGCAFGEDDR